MDHKSPIVIIGAGLAGISTAYFCADSYDIYEQSPQAGGLCSSRVIDGFTFDCDGHLLHFRDPETQSLVFALADTLFERHERNSWVFSKNAFTRYPFQANTYGLPQSVIKECLVGLVTARNTNVDKELPRSFEKWILQTFGDGYARHFFLPYNRKLWTMEPSALNCDWLDGFIPVPTMCEAVEGALEDTHRLFGYNTHFWYPRSGGIQSLANVFTQRIKPIYFQHKITAINTEKHQITFSHGPQRSYEQLILTLPLPDIFALLNDLPAQLRGCVDCLRATSVYTLNLGIKRARVMEKHWVYFPEDEYVFFRVGSYSSFSASAAPKECSSLYAEVSYSDWKPIDKQTINARIKKDLIRCGIVRADDTVCVEDNCDIKNAYVIYDQHRAEAVHRLHRYLASCGITLIGRYAQWEYLSMEDVIRHAKQCAERMQQCFANG